MDVFNITIECLLFADIDRDTRFRTRVGFLAECAFRASCFLAANIDESFSENTREINLQEGNNYQHCN